MIGLVTGGYGFIGNQLAELLSNEFSEVRILDNLSNVARVVRLPNVHLIEGDIRDAETTFKALRYVYIVSHTAARLCCCKHARAICRFGKQYIRDSLGV